MSKIETMINEATGEMENDVILEALTFVVGDEDYGIPISFVSEIIGMTDIIINSANWAIVRAIVPSRMPIDAAAQM